MIDGSSVSHISSVQLVNELTRNWGDEVSCGVAEYINEVFGPHFVSETPRALTYVGTPHSSNDVFFRRRWREDYQRFEYLIPDVVVPQRSFRAHPRFHWREWLRKELEGQFEHYVIGQYADPVRCTVKYRWRTA